MGLEKQNLVLLEIFYERPIEVQKAISLLEKQGFKKNEIVILKAESLIVKALRKLFFWTDNGSAAEKARFKIQLMVPNDISMEVKTTLQKYTSIGKLSVINYF